MFDKQSELNKLQKQFVECTDFLQAIGDASRQKILIAIMQGDFGGSRVGDIAKKAHLSEPAVSHHLKILKVAGILKVRSVGTKNYYYIDASSKQLARAAELLSSFGAVAEQFAALQTYEEDE